MIVADTNLVSYLLIEGERTDAAREVWARDPDWVVPPLWRSEFLNVLATAHRAGVLSEDQARLAWQRAKALLGRREVEPDAERVLALAMERKITAYDAHFAVVAEELGVPVVTVDKRILETCADIAISIEEFAAGE